MAKSIRSKRKRKMRAIKRVRYAKKELIRLKKTLGISDDQEMKDGSENSPNIDLTQMKDDATVSVQENVIEFSLKENKSEKSSGLWKEKKEEAEGIVFPRETSKMKVVTPKDIEKLGHYPRWMNQRQIRKMSKLVKQNKKKLKKIGKLKNHKM